MMARTTRSGQITWGVPTTIKMAARRPPPIGISQRRARRLISPLFPAAKRSRQARYSAMALSDVQFSKFSEMMVGMILTFLSQGRLECLLPMSDDERRDIEAHLKEHFRLSLAIQVKAAHVLYRHGKIDRLQKRFMVKANRLISDPFFFYFFGYLDTKALVYRPPVFFVPSEVLHREALHRRVGNIIYYNFVASMDPRSRDKWREYAFEPAQLAEWVMAFLRDQARHGRQSPASGLKTAVQTPGGILVARAA